MSTHNICFHGQIRKYQYFWIEKSILSRTMHFLVIRLASVLFSFHSCWSKSEEFQPAMLLFKDEDVEHDYIRRPDSAFRFCILCVTVIFICVGIVQLIIMPR